MGDYLVKAEKKLIGWGVSLDLSTNDDAAMLLENAAKFYKLAKSWDLAGKAYVKRANCFLKSENKHDAAYAYAEAAKAYKKVNRNG
ncbi:hypothetical protein AALP_AA7G182300 [Arabis alpina]|uniref:Alpha-soluble nsf attachment protein n=1 Tax=Arabis alpina TaxID=50452 RepID=A0A087GIW1_ARAAL|nr:hypothetical protein AALP_AA7G182300 [Arabis alpina]